MTAKLTGYTQTEVEEFFAYLDALRESGVTNMFGAGPYVEQEFDMGRADAKKVVVAWMQTFKKDAAPALRATQALTE